VINDAITDIVCIIIIHMYARIPVSVECIFIILIMNITPVFHWIIVLLSVIDNVYLEYFRIVQLLFAHVILCHCAGTETSNGNIDYSKTYYMGLQWNKSVGIVSKRIDCCGTNSHNWSPRVIVRFLLNDTRNRSFSISGAYVCWMTLGTGAKIVFIHVWVLKWHLA
jgi:hypothetical protein